jgi:hypothetical protein
LLCRKTLGSALKGGRGGDSAMDLLASNRTEQWEEWRAFISQLYESKSVHKYPPTNSLEEWWLGVVNYFGDFHLVMAFYIFMNICYAIFGILFWVIDKFKLLDQYKVQPVQEYLERIEVTLLLRNM